MKISEEKYRKTTVTTGNPAKVYLFSQCKTSVLIKIITLGNRIDSIFHNDKLQLNLAISLALGCQRNCRY